MIVTRVALASVAAVGALVVARPPAEACSCAAPTFSLPADGATGVPTALPELLFEVWYWESAPISLVGPLGDVPLGAPTVTRHNGFDQVRVPVLAPLEPATTYQLTADVLDQLDPVQVTFTTGDGAEPAPPPALSLDGFALAHAEFADGVNWSCGQSLTTVGGELATSGPEPAAIDVTFIGGSLTQHYVLPYPYGLSVLGSSQCTAMLVVEPSVEYCVEVRARDLSGNLGPPAGACAVVRACNDLTDAPANVLECPTDDADDADDTTSGCTTSAGPGGSLVWALGLLGLRARRRRR